MRHDTGNKLGFLKAVVYFALRRAGSRRPVHGLSERVSIEAGVSTSERSSSAGCSGSVVVDACGAVRARRCWRRSMLLVAGGSCRRGCLVGSSDSSLLASLPSTSFAGLPLPPRLPSLPFLRVVGDVPAGALELKGGRRQQLRHRAAAALRAHADRCVRKLLDHLELVSAGLAAIFVERHRDLSVRAAATRARVARRRRRASAADAAE